MNRLSWDKIQTRPRVNLKRLKPYSTESERRRIDMEVLKQEQLCKNSNTIRKEEEEMETLTIEQLCELTV